MCVYMSVHTHIYKTTYLYIANACSHTHIGGERVEERWRKMGKSSKEK